MGERDDGGETGLRPLVACTAASGVMTLGVLQFLGEVWGTLPVEARLAMLEATRTAFMAFLFALGALVLAWFARGVAGPLWRTAATLLALLSFAGSALIVTQRISRALGALVPQGMGRDPAEEIGGFIGLGVLALLALAAVLLVLALRQMLRRNES